MFNLKKKLMRSLTVAAFLFGSAAISQATYLDGVFISGIDNTLEDTSREAYIDVDNSGTFSVGDVITGYVRVEDVLQGSIASTGTSTYVVFSQQVSNISATGIVDFVATTTSGLQLNQLVSGSQVSISNGAILAVVTLASGFGDLITNPVTDLTGVGGITLADYFKQLSTGQLEFSGAIVNTNPLGDFFQASILGGALATASLIPNSGCSATLPLSTQCIANLPTSITLANFVAGLSIIDNNTKFTFTDSVAAAGFTTGTLAQLAITGGNATGASGQGPTGFNDASEFGTFSQCGSINASGTPVAGTTPCGFIDNADLTVHPVPEPASMILFGLGLTALGIYGRGYRRGKKSE